MQKASRGTLMWGTGPDGLLSERRGKISLLLMGAEVRRTPIPAKGVRPYNLANSEKGKGPVQADKEEAASSSLFPWRLQETGKTKRLEA